MSRATAKRAAARRAAAVSLPFPPGEMASRYAEAAAVVEAAKNFDNAIGAAMHLMGVGGWFHPYLGGEAIPLLADGRVLITTRGRDDRSTICRYVRHTRALAHITAHERRAFVEAIRLHPGAAELSVRLTRAAFAHALLAARDRDGAADAQRALQAGEDARLQDAEARRKGRYDG